MTGSPGLFIYSVPEAARALRFGADETDRLTVYDDAQRAIIDRFNEHSVDIKISLYDGILGRDRRMELFYSFMVQSESFYMPFDLQIEWMMDADFGSELRYERIGEHIARRLEWAFVEGKYTQEAAGAISTAARLIRTLSSREIH